MLKTLVVDDEINIREYIVQTLSSFEELMVVGSCGSIAEADILIKACKPDVVFLDIKLSDGNAFDLLSKIGDFNFMLVFLTSYEKYALKAIKCGAFDYLLKPLDIDEIKDTVKQIADNHNQSLDIVNQRVQLVQDNLAGKRDSITLRFKEGMRIVHFNEILYCFSESGYTTFYLDDSNKVMVSRGLKEYEKILPEDIFFRTHKSYLVNKNYIREYLNTGYIKLRNGDMIPVAFRRKEEVMKYFT